jgi:tryptophan synthase beta chain
VSFGSEDLALARKVTAFLQASRRRVFLSEESIHQCNFSSAIDEALDAKAKGEKRVILFNLSGHGNFDMGAYEAYLSGKLEDYEYPAEEVEEAMKHLPQVQLA